MLNDDVCEPALHRHVREELFQRLKAARGGTEPNDARRNAVIF
jgi:hypothetical protein